MRSNARRKYDTEFKRNAVRLAVTSGKPTTTIEKELGIYQGAIKHWKKELARDPELTLPGTNRLKVEDEEIRRLKRENEILREERDILKKAAAIFPKGLRLKRPGRDTSL